MQATNRAEIYLAFAAENEESYQVVVINISPTDYVCHRYQLTFQRLREKCVCL